MSEKYDRIMEKVEVTEDMRRRILNNIQNTNLNQKPKSTRFPQWKRYASIAACLAIILVGSLMLPKLLNNPATPSGQDKNPGVQGTNPMIECASVEALSEAVGFEVTELSGLPFELERTVYTSCFAELAQIDYYGSNGECATYRKSMESGDNSGIYTEYADEKEITADGLVVTLKGNAGVYELAVWMDGEFSYSVYLSDGVTAAEWSAIVLN